nr:hypothetical protein [Anaerolineae bacterium]
MTKPSAFQSLLVGLAVGTLLLVVLVTLAVGWWVPGTGESRLPVFVVAIYASAVSLLVIGFLLERPSWQPSTRLQGALFITLIIVFGLLIRIFLATNPFHNFDIASYTLIAEIAARGENVYAATSRYNYSPVWLGILGTLRTLPLVRPTTLGFIGIVRSFVSYGDLATLLVLALITRAERQPAHRAAALFFLNPVSFLTSGYHGQFENIAILALLAGVLGCYWIGQDRALSRAWLWGLATVGLIIKHNIFYEAMITTHQTVKRWWLKLLLIAASAGVFVLTLLPYMSGPTAQGNILQNVFLYTSAVGHYGFSRLLVPGFTRWVFIAGLIVYPFLLTSPDMIRRLLLGMLFFLAFTTGLADQYLVLPIALAALRPSRGFGIYTLVTTLYLLLGSGVNIALPGARFVPVDLVWVVVSGWFIWTQWLQPRIPEIQPIRVNVGVLPRSAAVIACAVGAMLIVNILFIHHAEKHYTRVSDDAVRMVTALSLVSPGETNPDMLIPAGEGALPCGLFAGGHGDFVLWLPDFPACEGDDYTILCLDDRGQWTGDNVSGTRYRSLSRQLHFSVAQDGTCGVLEQ